MSLAERLKQIRESFKKTQKEIAGDVSVSVQMWQAYEAGKSVPGGNVLEALARMGFNVNWILTGEGEMTIPVRLTESEAHQALKKRLVDMRGATGMQFHLHTLAANGITEEIYRNYLYGDYLPTDEELECLCKAAGGWDFSTGSMIDNVTDNADIKWPANYIDLDSDTTDAIDRILNEKSQIYGELSGGRAIIIMTTIYRIYSKNFIESSQFRMETMEKTIDALFRLSLPMKEQEND